MMRTRHPARLLAATITPFLLPLGSSAVAAGAPSRSAGGRQAAASTSGRTAEESEGTSSLVKHRPIVRRQGATLDFRPLSRYLEAVARTEDWAGAAMMVVNRYGVSLYEKEIGALALWKPVEIATGPLPQSALRELAGRGFLERHDTGWIARPRQLAEAAVAMLGGGEVADREPLSRGTAEALRNAAGPVHDLGDGFAAVLVTHPEADPAVLSRIVDLARGITTGEEITPEDRRITEAPAPMVGQVPDLPTHTLMVDGVERSYLLYAPPSVTPDKPLPLVVMLHGGGRTPRQALERTRWDLTAEREGFLVAFPEGGWNDGSGRGTGRDDVAFIAALIEEIAQRNPLDRDRVYLTGIAMGASMAFRAGYELAERVAAIAPVTGHFMLEDPPPLVTPVSLICIRGTHDTANPMMEDVVRISGGTGIRKPYVRDSVLKWVELLGLPLHSTLEYAGDGLFKERFGPGARGEEAVFYIIEGMGFQWPGGEPLLPDRVGPGSDRIRANDVIWEFFRRHGREERP